MATQADHRVSGLARAPTRLTAPSRDGVGNRRRQAMMAAGGVLGALASSSCCILPLVLFGLGVSGAWIGNFTRLAPYQPCFIATTIACLGGGAWLARRASRQACAEDAACARPIPNRVVQATPAPA